MAKSTETPCVKIFGETRRDETIELGNHQFHDFVASGTMFENCFLDIRGAGFNLVDATLVNCRIKVRRRISNVRFLETIFHDCKFEGQLVGCRFGFRLGESRNTAAYYRNCDFSKASLDLCDFFAGDVYSVTWPNWPNFVVLEPAVNKRDWLSIELPPDLKVTQYTVGLEPLLLDTPGPTDPIDKEPRAITINLARYKNLDPDAVWPLVQDKAYIVFNGKEKKPKADLRT